VPTSTVVMSLRDDLQMRILARRFCGAKPISQSASIEVFAAPKFSCARQTSSFQPSRPWSGSRLSPLTSPCPGLAQNNAALPCIIRVLTDACISARYTYPSRSLQNSSSSSRLFQLWLSLVSFRSFHQFHCYFQIGSPCVLSSSHFSCDMSPSPNSAMTTSYANRHRHDWRMSLTPNSNAGRC